MMIGRSAAQADAAAGVLHRRACPPPQQRHHASASCCARGWLACVSVCAWCACAPCRTCLLDVRFYAVKKPVDVVAFARDPAGITCRGRQRPRLPRMGCK